MIQHTHPKAPTPFLDTANFAARDENVRCLSYGVLRKLAGLPHDLFADYWRDVLGTLCARLPGISYYAQHHFSQDHRANLWPVPDGVRRMDVMLDGAAEIGFADIDGLNRYAEASPVLFGDVSHLFEHIVAYNLPRGSHTLVDREPDGIPNGSGPVVPRALASERRVWRGISALAVGMGATFGIRTGGAEVAPASAGTLRQRAPVAAIAPRRSSG
jgi:hypothetical protein